jgi:hypothetical protein
MFSKQGHIPARTPGLCARAGTALLALCLSLAAAGCASTQLANHAAAFSAVTAPVVDQAAEAYRSAESLHELRTAYDAEKQFDQNNPPYDPANTQVLLTDQMIQARLDVLKALQLYAKQLVVITGGTDSPALDAASKSIGSNLTQVANNLGPSLESVLGIAPAAAASTTQTTVTTTTGSSTTTTSSSSSTPAPLIGSDTQNAITLAANALGQFLVDRTIAKELPQKVETMDPHIESLCQLLDKEVGILEDQQTRDYKDIIDRETDFILQNKLDPVARRDEIMKLPAFARQQKEAAQELAELHDAIFRFYMTHHALAAAAQGNNPTSFQQKLQELEPAGDSLGKLYASLSAAQ